MNVGVGFLLKDRHSPFTQVVFTSKISDVASPLEHDEEWMEEEEAGRHAERSPAVASDGIRRRRRSSGQCVLRIRALILLHPS